MNSSFDELSSPPRYPPSRMTERLTRRDWLFIVVCLTLAAASLFVILNWFSAAFPEAAIEFRYDRNSSASIAQRLLTHERLDAALQVATMKHTATFADDDAAKIFLERSLGLAKANAVMKRDVHVWYWRHRWFRPLQEEELQIDVAPTGEIVSFTRRIPEARPMPTRDATQARVVAEAFLATAGIDLNELLLVSQSERALPKRTQRIFTWESRRVRPSGAPYRYVITIDGDAVSSYSQRLRVPDNWLRDYHDLRSKNLLAGNVDLIFLGLTIAAALVIFIIRLVRGDIPLRLLAVVGAVSALLAGGVALNSFPSELAGYDTTMSYAAFLGSFVFRAVVQALGTSVFLVVLVGAGEVLYRERLPRHLALPRLWTPRALASKRVFRSFLLGYTMVAFFLAYQVVFYLVADRFGAWSPAEIPYDDILNSALPWVAVLFAGFFPALSEEFMSRAFSLPFFERIFRSRIAAIVVAGFVWGFGHATYPNQPFFIRGVEVGLAGVAIGFLFYRFGLLPLLIWHYTVDALYTALLLFRSGNRYYVISAALSSLVFAVPMLISIVLYIRNRGFITDDDLTNATLPVRPLPPSAARIDTEIALPPPARVTQGRVIACALAIAIAAALVATAPPSLDDVIDYRIDRAAAKQIAATHLRAVRRTAPAYQREIATPMEGFHSWDRESQREEGGAPGRFDAIAANYLADHGLTVDTLVRLMRTKIAAATWTVRFFTPSLKDESFVEVDGRNGRALGYHRYQDERAPGVRLEQPHAQQLAVAALPRYGLDPRTFDLKEALSFQQPNRRDWLFHFQERTPIAADAYRRATVRVAGDEVTQFVMTVKVPDAVYREAAQTTLLNVALLVLKIIGTLSVIAVAVAGFIVASRRGRFPWRRPAVVTAILAIFPLIGVATGYETSLFDYSTSIRWQTFISNQAVDAIRSVGLQLVIVFLSLVALELAHPFVFSLASRDARARLGRAAAAAALTAIAIGVAYRTLFTLLAARVPGLAELDPLNVGDDVAAPLPAFLALGNALLLAIEASAVASMFAVVLQPLRRRPWLPPLIVIAVIFCATVDPSTTTHHLPLMLASSIAGALVAWIVIRYVLGGNVMAWPLAVMLLVLLRNAATLAQNHRIDLQANALALAVTALLLVVWVSWPRQSIIRP